MNNKVYNFQFPSWCNEVAIFGYRFSRIEEYKDRLLQLQHRSGIHSEFQILVNTGGHKITSTLEYPSKELKAVFEWEDNDATALHDILVLLSIFTGREVFVVERELASGEGYIWRDPRVYDWGGTLRASLKYKGKLIEDPQSLGTKYNIGFEEGINEIYHLIRSDNWRKKYKEGYYLLLARQVFRTSGLESAFTQCWTIWEHLFALHNLNWLSGEKIRQLSSNEKISYILVKYGLKGEIDNKSRKRIKELAEIRNRLVHYGRFPKRQDTKNAEFFIRLTEFVIAKTLGLIPSEVFDTTKRLEDFLKGKLKPRW